MTGPRKFFWYFLAFAMVSFFLGTATEQGGPENGVVAGILFGAAAIAIILTFTFGLQGYWRASGSQVLLAVVSLAASLPLVAWLLGENKTEPNVHGYSGMILVLMFLTWFLLVAALLLGLVVRRLRAPAHRGIKSFSGKFGV